VVKVPKKKKRGSPGRTMQVAQGALRSMNPGGGAKMGNRLPNPRIE
jgi:hypothetical protein